MMMMKKVLTSLRSRVLTKKKVKRVIRRHQPRRERLGQREPSLTQMMMMMMTLMKRKRRSQQAGDSLMSQPRERRQLLNLIVMMKIWMRKIKKEKRSRKR